MTDRERVMEGPLWIDRYRPSLADLPQADARTYLQRVPHGPSNLLIYGPAGSGKTAAVYALADELHGEPDLDLMTINIADFFGMTKRELVEDPRFRGFIEPGRRQDSKASLVNHVLKEMAGYPPVSGDFKTVLLDNAEAMREDFQQALRRVMEQHYEATQFVLTTRSVGAIIDPIRSRCVQVPMRAPTVDEIVRVLESIAEAEEVSYDREGLAIVAQYAEGDLREAILAAQVTAVGQGEITAVATYEALDGIGATEDVTAILEHAERGNFSDARNAVDDLLITAGYNGQEVLTELLRVGVKRYEPETFASMVELAGEIDFDLVRGTSDRVHLGHFLSELSVTNGIATTE